MNVLFSFLGKTRDSNPYPRTRYRFDGGTEMTTSFFGIGLAQQMQPERLVIMGTPGSMWAALIEANDPDPSREEARLLLIEAAAAERVDESMLRPLEPALTAGLGVPVTLVVIPLARNLEEQVAILRRMAEFVSDGDQVTIDVTHGLRHLPMLGLAAAYYLGHVRHARIDDILYGAFELKDDDGIAPVIRLAGLLRVMEWVQTLAAYDKDGDYGAFAPLLDQEGLPERDADRLRRAAFQERINDVSASRNNLVKALPAIERLDSPLARLFVPDLQSRLAWTVPDHRDE